MSTPLEPRWRRLGPDERRSEILAAAIKAFGEQPYAAVQMAAVARDAGVARGLLHHYFGTKRDLYLEVVRTMMLVPVADEVTLPTGTLRNRVEASVNWLMTVLAAHGRTWLAVGVDGVGGDPEVRAILEEADDQAAQRVLDAIGFVSTPDTHRVALAAVRAYGGMVKSAVREWLDRDTLTQEQVSRMLTETLVALIETVLDEIG
ncbi:TetR/AcrR family transcriptional regulator [Williamsia sp. 1135]|uniref:TetR/AcrR family transcriptional regulator n=1 Tax=Williamsia sp. 1135 TaxID=1889262 RepID=UPI000A118ED4|nr:TetR/AcrR family transcriptional regulator [Williamsia sp. 1135]ORM27725.1 TetR family transcriptional regulator [Williamsia sp. 1135]